MSRSPSYASRDRAVAERDPAASPRAPTFTAYPPALVEATLERIVASQTFRRSQRHRKFLEHVVRAALANEHEQLKEVIIGLEVFGRDLLHYDPRTDPIVRVEAGRVREKLARYYATEGAGDAFEIAIPVGSYMPHVVRRKSRARATHSLGSLAVLPFNNVSGRAKDASFSIGLADQLIDTIGRVPGLKVVARVSAFRAHDKGMDAKAIGRLLGVKHVVEGSIQRSGSRVRCIAQLSRARDSMRIWSQRFEHDQDVDDNLFAFQDRITDAILAALAPTLAESIDGHDSPSASMFGRPVGSDNPQARDLFERARYLAQRRSIEGFTKAIEIFERAVVIDPRFAQAYSHLGAARLNLAAMVFEPTLPAAAKAEAAALRALELDPTDGQAHAIVAAIAYRIAFDWKKAEPLFREALRLAPNSMLTHNSYATALVLNDRHVEAIRHAQLALELDPLNLGLRAGKALNHLYARDFKTSTSEFLDVLELDPAHLFSHLTLGSLYLSLGLHENAMPHFEFVAAAMPVHPSAHFCKICVYGMRGEIEYGRRELAALVERLPDSHYSPFYRAMAETCLGDREAAYASFERAAQMRDILFVTIPAYALFDRYHADPEFIALLRRHGLDLLPRSPLESFPDPSPAKH